MTPFSNPNDLPDPLNPADLALDRIRFAGFCIALVGAAVSISLASIGSVAYTSALILAAGKRVKGLPHFPFLSLAAVFAAVLAVSIVINGFPKESWQGLLKYGWGFLLLYAGVDVVRGKRRWLAVAVLMMACEGIAAVSGITQDFTGKDFLCGRSPVLLTEQITRITGPFKHCNDFGTFLIPGWLLGCSLAIEGLRKRKAPIVVFSLLFSAVIGWAMFRTMARGAMIGAGAGMIILALTLPHRRLTLSAMVSCAALVWWVPSPVSTRLHQLIGSGDELNERIFLIKGALKMIHESPWFGLGPNTYSRWFPIFNPPDPQNSVIMYAHNSYLQTATEIGWVGLGVFASFLAVCLFRAASSFQSSDPDVRWIRAAMLAAAVGLLVNALFDSLLQSTQLRTLFWSLLGLSLAGLAPLAAVKKGRG